MDQTEARRLRPSDPSSRAEPTHHDFPDQPQVDAPLDLSPVSGTGLVAQRARLRRQPPEMSLNWGAADEVTAPPAPSPDVAYVCGMPTAEFAYRLAELASRLDASVRQSGDLDAKRGLAVVSLQARMYEHLYLLQTASGDVT